MTDNGTEDRRIRKTRKAIRTALTELLCELSAEQITIKHIANRADIGYTTFFRHFPSKEAAIADLAANAAAAIVSESLPLMRSGGSRTSCLALCHHIDRNRTIWLALLTSGAAGAVRTAMIDQTVERSREWPNATSWLPREAGTALATGLVIETIGWWLSKAQSMSAEQVAEIMDRLFISALVGETATQH